MKVADLIQKFCEEHPDKYDFYEKYSGRWMFGRLCCGIVVRQGFSPMAMMFELTQFLNDSADDIDGTPFEGTSYDSLGLDTIVYFPCISDDE